MPYPQIRLLGAHGTKTERRPHEWNPFQTAQLAALFHPDVELVVSETGVRTGKTGTMGAFHRYMAKKNPGVMGLWIVESFKWYNRIAHRTCQELFGYEAEWHHTNHVWTWRQYGGSSVMVCTYQDLQSMQGATAGWGSIDEYQNVGEDAYKELMQRISDRRVKKPTVFITGLPVFDSWAHELAVTRNAVPWSVGKAGGHKVIAFEAIPTSVNASNLMADFDAVLEQSLDPDEYERRIKGLRPLPTGTVFKRWSAAPWSPIPWQGGNIIDEGYNPLLPLSLDVDFGFRRSGVVATQIDKMRDLDIMVDEYNYDDMDTDGICRKLAEVYGRPGDRTKRRLDMICCDPAGDSVQTATALTDINILRSYFPWADIRFTFTPKLRNIANGIKEMSARVCNAAGRRRLVMSKAMWERGLKDRRNGPGYRSIKRGRSAALSILRTIFPEDAAGRPLSEEPLKCPIDGHTLDAMRYGTINRHGVMGEGGQFNAR